MQNNPQSQKILIITAHPDDEVLGAGGTILKHIKAEDEVSILILSEGETSKDSNVDAKKRENEARKVAKSLNIKELFLEKLPDNQFDSLPLLKIVKIVEQYLNRIKPSIIYTHNPYDLNIDHRLTFEAVLTASRPQPKHFVKQILSFEILSSTEWQIKDKRHQFYPTFYNDITGFIDRKIEILEIYKDELKEYPHPRSKEGVRVLAKYRGIESGYNYAEAFQLIRELND